MSKSKQRYTRWGAIVLIAVMVFTLAACGGNNNGSSTTTSPSSKSEATTAPKSDVKLTMWHWKIAFDPGFKAVADAFKEKTGITVETQATTPDDAYFQKLTASAAAGNLPDIWAYHATPLGGAYDGKAVDWSESLKEDEAWKAGFLPAALSGITVSQATIDANAKSDKASSWSKAAKIGQTYGVPLDVGAFYMVYGNKKLVESAGLEAKTPKSMEEWQAMMGTVKEKTGIPGLVFSAKSAGVYASWFVNFVDYMKNGSESFTKFMKREEPLSDPKHIWSLQLIDDMAKKGLILPGSVTLDIDTADQAFSQGKAAFSIGGTFTYASLKAIGMNTDDIFSFRVPAFEGSVEADATVTPFPLVQIVANNDSPHKKEAMEFVKFLTSEEGQILYANNAFDLPAVKIKDTSKLNDSLKAMAESLSSESNWWSENPAIGQEVFKEDWKVFHNNMVRVMLGEMTVEDAAKDYDKAAAAFKAKEAK
ncbi:ABC transporter substrate-binding protein [Paenibacillus eucommiae]|uniref:Multiple sugar transport system substrate-binding protein n=1 Tax=Paenibacillus eucommiae TaxID=1355755 RepID=A0ABS4IY23_9BACL|nr:extracellular solute-binding protein [Paenibacillus eucommiae]MBP1991781.1 multiple sugar transport system substrate-binding protein [Paenibacillus eucommiae]